MLVNMQGKILLFLVLGVVLELYVFVQLAGYWGFLATLFALILVCVVGVKLCTWQMRRWASVLQELSINPESQLDLAVAEKKVSMILSIQAYTFAIVLFIIPGFITDAFALLLMIGVSLHLFKKAGFLNPNKVKGSGFERFTGRFFSDDSYTKAVQEEFGMSDSDKAKEEQARCDAAMKEMYGDVPPPSANASNATVSEMKSKFQAPREVKEAKFEEINDDDEADNSANNSTKK